MIPSRVLVGGVRRSPLRRVVVKYVRLRTYSAFTTSYFGSRSSIFSGALVAGVNRVPGALKIGSYVRITVRRRRRRLVALSTDQ